MHGPSSEIPAVVAWEAMLARGEDLAVALLGARVRAQTVEFTATVRSRHGRDAALRHPLPPRGEQPFGPSPRGRMRLELVYADGRHTHGVVTRRGLDAPAADDEEASPVLYQAPVSSSPWTFEATLILTPLPPPGGLTVTCGWPAQGLPDTHTVLATDEVAAAAARVQQLWPEPVPEDEAEPAPSPPVVPPGGWFAGLAGPHHGRGELR